MSHAVLIIKSIAQNKLVNQKLLEKCLHLRFKRS